MYKTIKLFFLLALLAGASSSFASHIVGGEIYYKYQGSNRYTVKLILYRDCSNPLNLLLDDSVTITAYRRYTTDAVAFNVYRQSIDTLPITISSTCSQLPDVCVERHTYTATVTLPSSTYGWTLFFSSCCRNATVGNISSPDNTGATYVVSIPPTSQLATGFGNPEFNYFPPIAICANKPINFNNSISSNPGDSVVYSLYTPLTDIDSNANNQYVFNPVSWRPPYSQADMLGGTPLTINPSTGFLSGVPNTIGQFLVGVQAKVYRNGVLVSETRRDFQFNVTDCYDNVGFTYTKSCGSKFVSFTNRTRGHSTFTWNFGDGSPTSSQQSPNHTFTNFGTYTVTLHTDSIAGCPSTFSQSITLGNDKPTANFSIGNVPNCIGKGDTIRLTNLSRDTSVFPIVSWEWYVNGSIYAYDKNIFYYFDPNDAFFFSTISIKLVVKTATGCADSISKNITIRGQNPDYTLTHDYNICQSGSPQSIRVDLSYNFFDFPTFHWSPSTGVSNVNSPTPSISVTQPSTYYITISKTTNSVTCSVTDSIQIHFQKPDLYLPKDTSTVCGSTSIKVTPIGDTSTYSIQWSTNPNFTNIITNGYSVQINKPGGNSITYYYKTSFGSGCTYTDSIKVNFISGAPSILLADRLTFCSRNISIPVSVNPNGGVQWSTDRNFGSILSTSNPLTLTQAQNQVLYFVRSGSGNCVAKDSVLVTANDPLNNNLVADTFVCGNKVLLHAHVNGISVSSIQWSFSNTFSPVTGSSDTLTVYKTAGSTRKVYIQLTATNSCTVSDSLTITFNDQAPVITLTDDTITCSNHVQISAGVVPASDIIWSSNTNFTPVLSTSNTLNVVQSSKTIVYYIQATNNGCSTTDSVQVTIPDVYPQIRMADQLAVCADSVRLSPALTNTTAVQWSLNPDFSTTLSTQATLVIAQTQALLTYYLKAFYNSCFVTDSIQVSYNSIFPDITLTDSLSTCDRQVNIAATILNQDNSTWYSDRNLSDSIASGTVLASVPLSGMHTYYIRAEYKGCFSVDSIVINNNSITYSDANLAVCQGNHAAIQLGIQTSGPYQIDWKFRDSTFNTTNDAIDLNTDSSGILSFLIRNSACSASDSIQITVNPNPAVDAVSDKDSIRKGEQIQLNAVPDNGLNFSWEPQSLVSNASIPNPTALPDRSTTFIVRVTDNNGCKANDSVRVIVYDLSCNNDNVYIPNAFTPNGDNINDIFRARVKSMKSVKLIVYNRYGEKVFETTNPDEGWDGNYKNAPAPADSYGYYFTGECLQGDKLNLKGNVTLMR